MIMKLYYKISHTFCRTFYYILYKTPHVYVRFKPDCQHTHPLALFASCARIIYIYSGTHNNNTNNSNTLWELSASRISRHVYIYELIQRARDAHLHLCKWLFLSSKAIRSLFAPFPWATFIIFTFCYFFLSFCRAHPLASPPPKEIFNRRLHIRLARAILKLRW